MRKSLGNKRNYVTDDQISQITDIYTNFTNGKYCKIFDNEDFGFTKLTVERPQMNDGKIVTDKKGNPVTGLKRADFLIYDKGKPQTITEFEQHILSLPSVKADTRFEILQNTAV